MATSARLRVLANNSGEILVGLRISLVRCGAGFGLGLTLLAPFAIAFAFASGGENLLPRFCAPTRE
jgi:hypothetical protein